MKFLRQLIAVAATVAVVVALGLLWAHVSGGGPGAGSALRRPPARAALARPEQVKAGVITVPARDGGFHLADAGDLIKTGMIEAVLASMVITASVARRRHRRRRGAASA